MDTKEKEHKGELNLETNWNGLTGKIKKEFTNVTNEDLQFMSRGEAELIGRLQIKSGRTKSQIRDWLRSAGKIM